MLAPATTRTVIGGVGYRNLRDHSLGIVMSDELEPYARPPELLIEDLCYGPVAVGQWLLDEALVAPITRAVFVTAVAREDGRPPGTISASRWDRVLPSDEEIPRAGTLVERRWQYCRWNGGAIHAWITRRKRIGRGEGSSGLAYDVVRYSPGPSR